jgi:hypothetical protein
MDSPDFTTYQPNIDPLCNLARAPDSHARVLSNTR